MSKHHLTYQYKSTGVAYFLWILFGAHYIYLDKPLTQILFWITLGGLGFWWFLDLILIPSKIENYNRKIANQIARIEKKEKEEERQRIMELASQIGKNPNDVNPDKSE